MRKPRDRQRFGRLNRRQRLNELTTIICRCNSLNTQYNLKMKCVRTGQV